MRLIDVDELKERLGIADKCDNCSDKMKSYCDGNSSFALTCELICNAPTVDAVPVVRCLGCSHSEVCKMDDGDVRYCHIFEMQTEDDYYCADGERREEDDLLMCANHDGEREDDE